MRARKLALAVLVGIALFYGAVIFAGGLLAAIAIPRSYFDLFGQQHTAVALGTLGLLVWALPVIMLVCAGYFGGSRLLPGLTEVYLPGVVLGMLASFGYSFGTAEGGFGSLLLVPWWGLPGLLAPWLGVALGAWLVARGRAQQGTGAPTAAV